MKRVSAFLKQAVFAFFALGFAFILAGGAEAQRLEHYNSPLYSPKNYDPSETTVNGLPDALQNIGIEQRLNEHLPLDTQLKDEDGNPVKLGQFFGNRKPVILA